MDKPILLFDGVCNLCNGLVQFIIKRDKREKFMFASLQSQSAKTLLEKFNLPAENSETIVLMDGDKFYTRSSAALRIAKELGGAWKLFYALIILPRTLRDFIYNRVARNRYKILGKRDACMVPSEETRWRFLP